jgi:hypothetical protein
VETDIVGVFTETLTTDVEVVLADQTSTMSTDTAIYIQQKKGLDRGTENDSDSQAICVCVTDRWMMGKGVHSDSWTLPMVKKKGGGEGRCFEWAGAMFISIIAWLFIREVVVVTASLAHHPPIT